MRTRIDCVVVLAAVLGMTAGIAAAQDSTSQSTDTSELHRFEKSIQPPEYNKPTQPHTEYEHHREHGDGSGSDLVDDLGQGLVDLAMNMLEAGGVSSLQRLEPGADPSQHRNDGDLLIPFVRYDFAYQRVSSDITAHFNRFEGGYGPVALFLEDYAFSEQSPPSSLTVKRQMFLYRMSGSKAEMDIGLGQTVILGTQRTVINALSVRGRIMFDENISIDIFPIWGDGMADYELALHYGRKYGSLMIGYRSLNSYSTSLEGPFAGFALYF